MKLSAKPAISLPWLHVMMLLTGFLFTGWLLAAFQAPWLVWLGTLGVTLHLIKAEADAIVLSNAWIVIIMLIAAVKKSWTPAWNVHIPSQNASLWAAGLLLIWLNLITLVILLAFVKPQLRSLGWSNPKTSIVLVASLWSALVLGALIYQS